MTADPWILYPALFLAAGLGGLVDSVAGGGGLITIPIMLGFGIPPQQTLGTNKFQASFGSFTASAYYTRHNVVNLRDALPGILFTAVGSAAGALLVQQISPDVLREFIPYVLLVILLYVLLKPDIGSAESAPLMGRVKFYALAGLAFGFYDGFFGPGVGTFWTMAFMLGSGFGLLKATGYTKAMNFTSNVVALAMFTIGGNVLFSIGITMAVGQALGARIGSRLVVRRGAKFIRPIFLTVVLATTIKLFYDLYIR